MGLSRGESGGPTPGLTGLTRGQTLRPWGPWIAAFAGMTNSLLIFRDSLQIRLSALGDRVFRENLLDPFEGFLRHSLRRHSFLHDIDPADTPDMLVLDLCIGRIVGPELRHGRAKKALRGVGGPVRVVEPPVVCLDDRGHARNVPAEPRLQPLVVDLWLDDKSQEVLGYIDVLRPLRDQEGTVSSVAWHGLAVVAERQAHRDNVIVIVLLSL